MASQRYVCIALAIEADANGLKPSPQPFPGEGEGVEVNDFLGGGCGASLFTGLLKAALY